MHGLIFLFKWIGNTEIDGSFVTDSRLDDIVFVKQVIENACATQAIISVLLNCHHADIDLGDNLKDFKAFVSNFDPDVSPHPHPLHCDYVFYLRSFFFFKYLD